MPGIENPSQPLRIAIINRKFWPISGAAEMEVANLGRALTAEQHRVDILTVRWQKHWPAEFRYHDCDVYRLTKRSSGPFGSFRYLKALTSHLGHRDYDRVIVFGLGEEAWTAATAIKDHTMLVLRLTQLHLTDIHELTARQRETLKSAAAILADTPATADFIRQHQPEAEHRIRVVAPMPALPEDCVEIERDNATRKTNARVALSDAHPILQIDAHQPLVITCAPMESDLGVCDLVRAWPAVQRKHTKARLWILGEGKLSKSVWEEILELELVYTVIMPGFFDNLSLVLDAADLYVHPLRTQSACSVLQTAKAMGVCTVETASLDELKSAATSESARPFIQHPDRGLLVPRETPTALSATIHYLFEHPECAADFGSQTQRRLLNRGAQVNACEAYLIEPAKAAVATESP